MDFTIKEYKKLLQTLIDQEYTFQTMESFLSEPSTSKLVVLRHDVDERPENALKLAKSEFEKGIKATYYFRLVKISNDPEIIRAIADLGHEIGYHYEDYALNNGDLEKSIESFTKNLTYFRTFYPVKTVCMHGSSMSNHDNRTLWKHYELSDFDIIGEPYLSIDYTNILYLTDTGRCWDGGKYSVRDFVNSNHKSSFHYTSDIISALKTKELPKQMIIQSHTLWTDSFGEWFWLLIRERLRNNFKRLIVKMPIIKRIGFKLIKSYSQ